VWRSSKKEDRHTAGLLPAPLVRREGLEPPTRWLRVQVPADEVARVIPIRRLRPLKVLPLKVVPLRLLPALTLAPSSTALRAA